MARAILCRDGALRTELRVTFRMSLDELAAALVTNTARYWAEEHKPDDMTQAGADKAIRRALLRYGEAAEEGWADGMSEAESVEWIEWARRQVRKVYPDLDPQGG
jgi:hypothetical protein